MSEVKTMILTLAVDGGGGDETASRDRLRLADTEIKVPSNYDPASRTYSGVWDGKFKIAPCRNPAWCFYDLLTVARLGHEAPMAAERVDRWTLYMIGQYCDEIVPDGSGGHASRFSLTPCSLDYPAARRVMHDLEGIFQSMPLGCNIVIPAIPDAADKPKAAGHAGA